MCPLTGTCIWGEKLIISGQNQSYLYLSSSSDKHTLLSVLRNHISKRSVKTFQKLPHMWFRVSASTGVRLCNEPPRWPVSSCQALLFRLFGLTLDSDPVCHITQTRVFEDWRNGFHTHLSRVFQHELWLAGPGKPGQELVAWPPTPNLRPQILLWLLVVGATKRVKDQAKVRVERNYYRSIIHSRFTNWKFPDEWLQTLRASDSTQTFLLNDQNNQFKQEPEEPSFNSSSFTTALKR